jgi:tetratricopeptide (TPR) repeat protein
MVQIQDVTPVDDDAARSGERLRLAGNAAYNSGDFEAAARSYRDSLEAAPLPSPSAPKALGNLAKALLMLGHPGEALANAERYVQACPPGTPDAAKARFRKGEALEATGDLRAAREAYRDAAKDAPGDEKVRGALARVSETIERRRRESAEPGVSAKAETRFETAERETSRARAPPRATKTLTLDDEKKNQAAYSRAKRAIREARYEEAVEAFACYTLPPSRPDRALSLFLNRARALTELGRHEEALRDARAAVNADQESRAPDTDSASPRSPPRRRRRSRRERWSLFCPTAKTIRQIRQRRLICARARRRSRERRATRGSGTARGSKTFSRSTTTRARSPKDAKRAKRF